MIVSLEVNRGKLPVEEVGEWHDNLSELVDAGVARSLRGNGVPSTGSCFFSRGNGPLGASGPELGNIMKNMKWKVCKRG